MITRTLDRLFNPERIALVGASARDGSVGAVLLRNVVDAFGGEVYPVNPRHEELAGVPCYGSVLDIEPTPDLAVLATPAATVVSLLDECGRKGIPAAMVISAGFRESGSEGKRLEEQLEAKRREYGIRIIGPNCLGLMRPGLDLNLTFLRKTAKPGGIAFFSQSGAMGSAILDWAAAVDVGFSAFVSVGNMMDVDFGDLIDYFGNDRTTRSIIMYLESVSDAAHFMSAARAFARSKPLLVIKAGKHARSAEAVASHTGSLAGQDAIYDAAFRRVGVTRVDQVGDLFTCSEVLAKQPRPWGARVCILTNAGGPGILAADAVLDGGGTLAELADETRSRLEDALPSQASKGNPVDVLGDADADRYRKTGTICVEDEGVDGLLVVYSPQGEAGAEDAAQAVAEVAAESRKPVLASWMGGEEVAQARRLLLTHNVPTASTPEEAVRAYLHLHRYARNLELLYETPDQLPVESIPPRNHLQVLLQQVVKEERTLLSEIEAKKFLDVYDIPVSATESAQSPERAAALAERFGFPVALKVLSPDLTHKSDVGGVKLGLTSAEEVRAAFEEIRGAVERHPDAPLFEGVTVQPMVQQIDLELILGAMRDPVFGSVIVFGRGGTGVELYRDTAIGFPPLNQVLARRLMHETKVVHLLEGYRGPPLIDLRRLEELLVRFSQLVIDFPQIKEIDINPLAISDGEPIGLDARMMIDPEAIRETPEPCSHLAIEPYPRQYIERWRLEDGREVALQPIRPEDEPRVFELFDTFSEETWRQRFFGPRRDVSHEEMTRYTNIDYRRTLALIGVLNQEGEPKLIGVGRLLIDPTSRTGEYAIVIGDPWQGLGLGEKLTDLMIGIAGDKGVKVIQATVLKDNQPMLQLCRKMGFQQADEDRDAVDFRLKL